MEQDAGPGLTATVEVQVAARRLEADGVVSLTLVSDGVLPAWTAGAHISLLLPGGMSRSYSLCGDRSARHEYRIAVRHDPAGRGGSTYVHEQLDVGATLAIIGPRNQFALVPASEYLFIAGGIGITPLLPMLVEAREGGASWRLLYGGRSRAAMPFLGQLAELPQVTVWPEDEHGLLQLEETVAGLSADTHVYVCGPGPLIDAVRGLAATVGVEAGRIHFERFVAEPSASALSAVDDAFEVVLARSDRVVEVQPHESVLEVLRRAGALVYSDCEEGICGACEIRVIEGAVDHRDDVLTEGERAAGELMMPCVSRCLGRRLIVDV